MSVRSYVRFLLVLVLLIEVAKNVTGQHLFASGLAPAALAGMLSGTILKIIAVAAGLLGKRWGTILTGLLIMFSVVMGFGLSGRCLVDGQTQVGTTGLVMSIALLGLGVGLLWLKPVPAVRQPSPAL